MGWLGHKAQCLQAPQAECVLSVTNCSLALRYLGQSLMGPGSDVKLSQVVGKACTSLGVCVCHQVPGAHGGVRPERAAAAVHSQHRRAVRQVGAAGAVPALLPHPLLPPLLQI